MCSPVDPELLTVKGLLPAFNSIRTISVCPSLAAAKSGVLPENTVTRTHSSRMRTVRCSGRLSCHAHPTPLPCTPLLPCTPHRAHPCHACPPYHACPILPCTTPCNTHLPLPHPLPCTAPLWTEFLSHACVVYYWVLFLHTLNQIDNRLLEVPLQELVSFIETTTYSTYQS